MVLNEEWIGPIIRLTRESVPYTFKVARDPKSKARMFKRSVRPTREGDPTTEFAIPFEYGFGGMGATDQAIPGMYDYGSMDARHYSELWPPPKRVAAQVTGLDFHIGAIFKNADNTGLHHLYVAGGSKIEKLAYSGLASEGVRTVANGVAAGPAVRMNNKIYLPMGSVAVFQELAVTGTGLISGGGAPDTWNAGPAGKESTAFGFGFAGDFQSLIRGTATGTIEICPSDLDPKTAGNWAASYQIEKPGNPVNSIVALGKLVYVMGPSGCYTTDEYGNGVNLTPETEEDNSPTNGIGGRGWHSTILYPHRSGLYQIDGLGTRPVGLEELPTFNGSIRGRVTCMAGYGHYLYLGVYDSNTGNSWVISGRQRSNGEPGFGPIVFHSIDVIETSYITAMYFDAGTDTVPPRLWVGFTIIGTPNTYWVSKYTLGRTGGPDPTDSNILYATTIDKQHYFSANHGGTPHTMKTARVIEVKVNARNQFFPEGGAEPPTTRYFQFAISWDSADNYNNIGDPIGAGNRLESVFFTPGTDDTGRIPKLRLTYHAKDETNGGFSDTKINPLYLEGGAVLLRGRHRPLRAEVFEYEIELSDDASVPENARTAESMWGQLHWLAEDEEVLTLEDEFRGMSSKKVQITNVGTLEVKSEQGFRPYHSCTLELMVLEYAEQP